MRHVWGWKNAYRISVKKLEGRRPLESPGRRWDDNVKMGIKVIVCEGMKWVRLVRRLL
jgi:hypothetical protein